MGLIKITEQRVLHAALGGAALGVVIMLICVCTDYWVIVNIPGGVYLNHSKTYLLSHHSGLWRICRTEFSNATGPPGVEKDQCRMLKFYPSEKDVQKDPEIDYTILDYSRAETAFAIISLMMMALGMTFSVYSLKEMRYMFKRLAAALHLMTAGCIVVCAEVLSKSVKYEREQLPKRLPARSTISFGFCYGLSWFCFILFLLAAIAFLFCSRKRKGGKARSEEEAMENEVVHLGRA